MIHSFNTKLAAKYGIEGAILIEHLYWWIHKNECNEEMFKEGRVWCYSTAKGFAKYIPYMNPQKIRRELLRLEELGVILINNFNDSPINKTLWYAFSDAGMKELIALDYDFLKMKNGVFKNEKSEYTIKEDNNNNKKNNSKELSKKVEVSEEYKEKENNFLAYMKEHYPLVQRMRDPLKYDEFLKLCATYERETIYNVLSDMNNWAELRKKRVSAYQTAIKWLSNAKAV